MRAGVSAMPSPRAVRRGHILIISRHDYRTARRASVHFLAQKMAEQGHRISFLSIGYSWLSRLRGDSRAHLFHRANRWEEIDGVRSFLWRSAWHPVKLPIPEAVTGWMYNLWANAPFPELDEVAGEADAIIVESGIAPALLPRLRTAAPGARILYRATDLLSTAGVPSCIEDMLQDNEHHVDRLVVVARAMLPHFDSFQCAKLFIPHGVDTDGLMRRTDNPYAGPNNAVSVGSMLFDAGAVQALAQAMPNFSFHLIGTPKGSFPPNVRQYGEMSFDRTLPYIQHADVGVAAYLPAEGCGYLADSSLKLRQYAAIGLPAVCPSFAVGDHALRFGYDPMQLADTGRAFTQAVGARRAPVMMKDWNAIAEELAEAALG
ncbi:xanthan biosynthesis glucuronosyltransferase GumK [Sphingobium bisphenolivorans]|uniref:GumK N-terminal domain-containing glycosyltransferase n=1 Tax=Sphingobium bisphenolivorans TaxID=1335760 RepID=UPI0003B67BCC|nr:xanthan biosynthesis glucuronosyltransferase GumK [Sphingobium bisphenolivorans]